MLVTHAGLIEFVPGGVADFKVSSRSAAGVLTQLAGGPALAAYKANGVAESALGLTLTVDFDGRTGLNHVRLDASADAAFYVRDFEGDVVLTAGTVGGVSVVGESVAHLRARSLVRNVDNTKVVPARMARLGTRHDDITIAWPTLALRPSEVLPVWIDCAAICGDEWLESAANAASSNMAAFTIATAGGVQLVGVNRELVVLWLNAVGTAGATSIITVDVTPAGGETLKLKLNMLVASD